MVNKHCINNFVRVNWSGKFVINYLLTYRHAIHEAESTRKSSKLVRAARQSSSVVDILLGISF